jgi:hypothetical protein
MQTAAGSVPFLFLVSVSNSSTKRIFLLGLDNYDTQLHFFAETSRAAMTNDIVAPTPF